MCCFKTRDTLLNFYYLFLLLGVCVFTVVSVIIPIHQKITLLSLQMFNFIEILKTLSSDRIDTNLNITINTTGCTQYKISNIQIYLFISIDIMTVLDIFFLFGILTINRQNITQLDFLSLI